MLARNDQRKTSTQGGIRMDQRSMSGRPGRFRLETIRCGGGCVFCQSFAQQLFLKNT
jgi:hypothetical protein